ncbi:MAG: tetratricopeptide repeat protein [Thermoguttaceae bacterium]|jgi:tetratricopeptide (TPR) repeat protein
MNPRPPRDRKAGAAGTETRRVLNWPLLIGTFCALAVIGPLAYAWHSYQVKNIAAALLERADALAGAGDWRESAGYLFRYLQLDPENAEVRVRLAQNFDQSAETPREKNQAIEHYYRALGVAPAEEQPELRRRLCQLLLETQPPRHLAAEQEATRLLDKDPNDAAALRAFALARYLRLKSLKLADRFEDGDPPLVLLEHALKATPGDIELSVCLASLYRDRELLSDDGLETQLRRVFDHRQDDKRATKGQVAAAEIEARAGRAADLSAAPSEIAELAKRASGQPAAQAPAGLAALLQNVYGGDAKLSRPEQAALLTLVRERFSQDAIDQMVAANPQDSKAYLARFQYRSLNNLPDAGEDLDAALERDPKNVTALLLAARRAEQQRSWKDVRSYCERLIQIDPKIAEAYTRLGAAMVAQREPLDSVIAHYQKALEACGQESIPVNSGFARALIELGHVRPVAGKINTEDVLNRLAASVGQLGPRLPRAARTSLEVERDSLWAFYRIARNEFALAIPLLKGVVAAQKSAGGETANLAIVQLQLGRAYGALGQWDAAAASYEEAAQQSAQPAPLQVAAAEAWINAGQPARAAQRYEQALAAIDAPELWLGLARARLMTQLSLPAARRDWKLVDAAVAKAEGPAGTAALRDPWRLALLKIDLAIARAQASPETDAKALAENGKKLAEEAEKTHPDSPDLLQAVALLYQRLGYPADADRALAALEAKAGSLAASLARARVLALRGQYDEACKLLEDAIHASPAEARPALQREIVRLRLDQGASPAAKKGLDELAESAITDIGLLARLCERALSEKNFATAEKWEKRLHQLEGAEGGQWRYYRAARLLATSQGGQSPQLAEAERLHQELLAHRPAWAPTHVLGGMVYERRQAPQQAVDAYKKAIELGVDRVSIYERLAFLLYSLQRDQEASDLVALLKDRVPASENLTEIKAGLAAKRGQLDEAIQAARDGVKNRPNDPVANLLLGQMLVAKGLADEAEAVLKNAVRVAPSDLRALKGLFDFYANAKKREPAEEALRALAAKAETAETPEAFVLAQGFEQLGDRQQAEKLYREAVRLAPKNAAIMRRFSAFLVEADPAEAEQLLRRALAIAPGDQASRRTLAAMLAARGGEHEWEEIARLLENPAADNPVTAVDQRLQAILLARRGGKDNLTKAQGLLEKLVADAKATTDGDRLLLAKIYERDGKTDEARAQYIPLVSKQRPAALHLALFIDFLLRFNLPAEAADWLGRLEDDPSAAGTIPTLTLRARVLKAQGKLDESRKLVEDYGAARFDKLTDQEQKTQLALAVGRVYSTLELHDAAEAWFRRAAQDSPKQFAPLAVALAKQGKADEAIELCRQAAGAGDPAGPAIVLASLVVGKDIPADKLPQVDAVFSQAIEKSPENANLLTAVANVQITRGQLPKAVELYQQALKIRPKDLVVLNNLATILAETPAARKEALRYIDQALEIGGPQDALLDTKAMILVQDGKADQAVKLLETACSHYNPDPRYPFHLAVAYSRTGEKTKARAAYNQAIESGLEDQILTDSDQAMLKQLQEEFK